MISLKGISFLSIISVMLLLGVTNGLSLSPMYYKGPTPIKNNATLISILKENSLDAKDKYQIIMQLADDNGNKRLDKKAFQAIQKLAKTTQDRSGVCSQTRFTSYCQKKMVETAKTYEDRQRIASNTLGNSELDKLAKEKLLSLTPTSQTIESGNTIDDYRQSTTEESKKQIIKKYLKSNNTLKDIVAFGRNTTAASDKAIRPMLWGNLLLKAKTLEDWAYVYSNIPHPEIKKYIFKKYDTKSKTVKDSILLYNLFHTAEEQDRYLKSIEKSIKGFDDRTSIHYISRNEETRNKARKNMLISAKTFNNWMLIYEKALETEDEKIKNKSIDSMKATAIYFEDRMYLTSNGLDNKQGLVNMKKTAKNTIDRSIYFEYLDPKDDNEELYAIEKMKETATTFEDWTYVYLAGDEIGNQDVISYANEQMSKLIK